MTQCARNLFAAFPQVQFTSGRRDLLEQATAMAPDVVANRQFIRHTYVHGAALQAAVDAHPEAVTTDDIECLLYDTLCAMSSDEVALISDHLSGNAVDLLPMEDTSGVMTPTGQQVYAWIHDCPDTKAFLTREGGLVRWHWSIKSSAISEV